MPVRSVGKREVDAPPSHRVDRIERAFDGEIVMRAAAVERTHHRMTRFQAAAIHLGISLAIAALVGCLIYFVWYPPPYFRVAGGSNLMLLIMGVDIVVGPLLTLVIYKAGKKGLRFDLACIAVLQAAAFLYGFWVIAQARPVFIVARLDRFIPVYANDLDDADLAQAKRPEFAARSWTGPRLVGAKLPVDTKEKSDLLFSALAGKDVEKFPKYYVPYADVADAMLAKAMPLSELAAKSPGNKTIIERYVKDSGQAIDQLAWLPLQGRTDSYTMVLSRASKQPLDALAIDPWNG
ncbi:MAG: TfpX/TfpZ family type IV pilin accessory protein [Rudaea sp.]|uniref:TfpX/TfpZ family type IV pilin accessory protein n=1 Tax=Rudaea sp. TaxID=2136325 RepID=UPI0039E6343A